MKIPPLSPALTTRRAFLGQAAALAACTLLPREGRAAASAAGKPNSVFGGVRIGAISYSYRSALTSAEELLAALVTDGLSEVELMGAPIQAYAGFAVAPAGAGKAKKTDAPPVARYTDAQREEQLAKCRALRKLYNDAGINIHIHKIAFGPSDEEVEFNFLVAKALGCEGITTERSEAQIKRLAPFAEKHRIRVGFHNHTTNFPSVDQPDPLLDYSKYVAFNFDVGHYVAGTSGKSPIPVLEKYHDRILNLHLKDRTAAGGNLPWGQGETPIREILRLMRKEKWTFPANIELEYKIPEGSDAVKEVAKCVDYCRAALA
ncbi:MAG: sugar phosphate isomerase/epimerase [Verrucomicrobia bacterium]|nr:sugar phosphate isomerase/epimerase [Verrucomicrobiota bacterium]